METCTRRRSSTAIAKSSKNTVGRLISPTEVSTKRSETSPTILLAKNGYSSQKVYYQMRSMQNVQTLQPGFNTTNGWPNDYRKTFPKHLYKLPRSLCPFPNWQPYSAGSHVEVRVFKTIAKRYFKELN